MSSATSCVAVRNQLSLSRMSNARPAAALLRSLRCLALGMALAATLLWAGNAEAVTYNWLGTTDTNFGLGSNWTGGIAPSTGANRVQVNTTTNVCIFPGTLGGGVITLTPLNDRGLVVGSGAGGTVTISSGSVTTNPTTSNGTDIRDLVGNNSTKTATLNVMAGGTYTSNAGLLVGYTTAAGVGILNLGGGQATIKTLYMGGTSTVNLDSGTLTLSGFSAANVATTTTGAVFNFNGGTLKAGTTGFTLGGITNAYVKTGGAVFDTNSQTITVSQSLLTDTVSLNGGLTKNNAGTLILSGANTYTGATAINAGTLQANSASALGNGGNIAFGGGTLQYMAASAGQDWGPRIKNSTGVIALNTNGQNATVSGIDSSNTAGLTKTGGGTLTIGGTNAYTGATAVNTGRLDLTGSLTSDVTIASGANLGGEGSTSSSLTFGGTSLLFFDPSTPAYLGANQVFGAGATVTLSPTAGAVGTGIVVLNAPGGITGTVGSSPTDNFQFVGRGTAYFNPTNTQILLDYAAGILAWRGNDGTNPTFWDVNTTANWYNAGTASADKFINGDTLTFDDTAGSYNIVVQGASVTPGNMTFNNGTNDYAISGGAIAGIASLVKNGSKALTLSGANSYTGGTTLNAGTLNIDNAAALGAASSPFTIGGGTIIDNTSAAAITTSNYPLTINGDFTFTGTKDLNLGAGITTLGTAAGTNRTVTVTAGTLTLGGAIGDGTTAKGIIKAGAGKLTLSGTNTFTGPISISGGTLSIGGDAQLGTVPAVATPGMIVLNGGTKLTVTGNGGTINTNRGMTLAGDATLESTGTSAIYRGVVTGAGVLTLSMMGTGDNQFGAATSDYSGGTILTAGSKYIVMDSSTGSASTSNLTAGPFGKGPITMNNVTIRATTSGAKTVGNAITLQGNITVNPPGTLTDAKTLTFNGPITLAGASRTITNNSGANFYLSGIVGDGGNGLGLTIAGTNWTVLSVANTYTGVTAVDGGKLLIPNIASLPGWDLKDRYTVAANGVLAVGNSVDNAQVATMLATGNFAANASIGFDTTAGTRTYSLALTDTGTNALGLVKTGSGILVLDQTNTYSGMTTIGSGVLSIASTASLPGWDSSGRYSVPAGSVLAVGNAVTDSQLTTMLTTGSFAKGSSVGFDTAAGNRTCSSVLQDTAAGTLGVTKLGAGVLTLDQTNTYTGVTAISNGVLSIASTASLPGWNASGRYTVAANTGLAVGNAVDNTQIAAMLAAAGNFAANSSIGFDTSAGDRTYSVVLANLGTNALGLVKVGAGTLVLDQPNTYTGVTAVRNGALQLVGGDNRLSTTANVTLGDAVTGGKLILGNADLTVNQTLGALNSSGLSGSVVGGNAAVSTLTVASGTFGGTLGGTGTNENNLALVKSGTGTLTLTGASTHTGGTTVSDGILYLNHTGDANPAIKGDVTVTGSSTGAPAPRGKLYLKNNNQLESTATVHAIPGGGFADLVLGGFSQTIAGFTYAGTGTAVIENYFQEAITNPGTLTFNSGSDIVLGANFWIRDGSSAGTGSLTVVKDGAAAITVGAGSVTNTGGWTLKNGALHLAGNFGGTVPLRLQGGTLSSDSTTARTISGNVSFDGDATLGNAVNSGQLTMQTGAATLTGNRQLTVDSAVVISQVIGQDVVGRSLTKSGAGTLTLSAVNTYTGATHIGAGTLKLGAAGSIAASPTINVAASAVFDVAGVTDGFRLASGQTLKGTGAVSGAMTVDSGATLQPGTSPGTLSTAGEVWTNGGNYNWMIHDAAGIAGAGYSQLAISGGLDLASLTTGGFNINLWSLSSIAPDVSGNALNFSGTSPYSWTLATTTAGITGFDAGNFSVNKSAFNGTGGFSNAYGTGSFGLAVAGNDLLLNFTPGSGGPVNAVWGVAGSDGKWSTGANWTPNTAPSGQGATANFTGKAPAAVDVDVAQTVGHLIFNQNDGAASHSIGGATLSMDNTGGTGNATIAATAGTHTIASRIVTTAASDLDVSTTGAGTTLHLAGGIDNSATHAKTVSLGNGGTGTLDVLGNIDNAGTLTVSGTVGAGAIGGGGTTNVLGSASLTADSIVQNTLTIGAGSSVTIRETAGGGAAVNAVPEPCTWALLIAGAACLLPLLGRLRRKV
jgi:fibronectin-binding autotransporter adhesin